MSTQSKKSRAPQSAAADPAVLRSLLDSLPAPAFALDRQQRLFFANRAWTELLGVAEEFLRGKTVAELVELMGPGLARPGEYRARVEALAADAGKTTVAQVEYSTDRRMLFKEISQPIRGSDGAHQGRLFLYLDITREKELDQTKSEFISIASHELKNPLSSILGYAQLSLRKTSPDAGSDATAAKPWQAVLRQAERLGGLVDQLLDVSRIQMGRLDLNRQPVDLGALARRVLEHLQVTTEQHRLVLDAPDTAVIGPWDAGLLEQVLTNLVGNAIKYSPEGGTVTVQVAAEGAELVEQHESTTGRGAIEQRRPASAVAQRWAVVRVVDQGIGIPKERQQQLFQRFSRAHNTARYRMSGLGLGLYISHEIVAQHGGRMGVVSEEGRGSQFYFSLPVD